ncbi:MAG: preQ(1) synthase [Candidatus Omnitrophota bacterium]
MKKNQRTLSDYENLQKKVRKFKMPEVEVWQNMYADKNYWIQMDILEFTCICPKTGLPDFAQITVEYSPGKYCLELKSLKYYINAYRDLGVFHEHAVNRILDDLVKSCKPRQMIVTGDFNLRGGIKTTVSAEFKEKKTKGKR